MEQYKSASYLPHTTQDNLGIDCNIASYVLLLLKLQEHLQTNGHDVESNQQIYLDDYRHVC